MTWGLSSYLSQRKLAPTRCSNIDSSGWASRGATTMAKLCWLSRSSPGGLQWWEPPTPKSGSIEHSNYLPPQSSLTLTSWCTLKPHTTQYDHFVQRSSRELVSLAQSFHFIPHQVYTCQLVWHTSSILLDYSTAISIGVWRWYRQLA